MGGLATGGRLKQPHLVNPEGIRKLGFAVAGVHERRISDHQSTVDIVSKAMWGVVNESGTATGRAVSRASMSREKRERRRSSASSPDLKGKEYEDNAWFVGFAPYRNPEIVVAAFIENGGWGGDAAAPVAHAVLETYYKKKMGKFTEDQVTKIAQK